MKLELMKFLKDEEGATAIEYGLIVGLIAIGIITGATLSGNELSRIFNAIGNKLKAIVIA
ncbi:MAG: Flp family type IVb pilin [Noviherbaspirillum sp.]